eukprot:s2913_g7.t1
MYHQSEIQKFAGVIQTLVAEMREMKQEDEGSEIRIQELERQRDTACLAMRHMNQVNQEMRNDFELAMTRISEQSHAQRQHDHFVTEELAQRLRQERNEAALSLVQLEERAQGDREYERLTSELHERARENLQLRAGMADSEHIMMTMKEHLHLVRNEEAIVAGDAMNVRASGIREQQGLRERLGEEEEFRSMAVRRMQKAEDQLRHVEDNAKQALPTMHEELNELRRALRLQEDMHARTRSELEAARLAPQSIFQQASSIPISSRTTESGWECVIRVQAFPVGTEVRSPEILTPSHRSPANREKFDFAEATQGVPSSVVEDAAPVRLAPRAGEQAPLRFAQRASSSSCPEKNTSEPNGARAVRNRQLNELLSALEMTGRASSSSFSGSRGIRHDGDLASDIAVANLVVEDAKAIAVPKNQDSSIHNARLKKLEDEYLEQIAEMRSEMEKAQKAEQRLRADRDEWRLMAENLQAAGGNDEGEEGENHDDEDDEPAHDTHGGDPFPEPDDDDDGGGPPRKTGRGPDRDPPDGDDPGGGDDPEFTEVKISRREADKVAPTVTLLDNWMAQCIANVLSTCADPNQEEWMKWLRPAFRPHPDIEGLHDSGHKKFKSIDFKLGVAMTAMLRAGSHKAAELYLEVNRKANDYVRSYEGKIIKGRQIIALGLHYENLSYYDPKRSYGSLPNIIDRTIMRRREQSNLTQTQVGLREMLEGKDLLAAPAKTAAPAPNGKPNKGNGKPGDAAPVLQPKQAAGSESTDSKADKSKKHIRCKFHFTDDH